MSFRLILPALILTFSSFLPSAFGTTISLATTVSAYSSEDEKLEAVLGFVFKNEASKFGWPVNYKSMWCPTNVFNLLRRLNEAHVDLSKARVWYIVPQDKVQDQGADVIHPQAARVSLDGTVSEWSFHVVVEIEGRILDLDYTSQPDVQSVEQYAAAMWRKGPLAVSPTSQPLFVREIPALEYLGQYASNWDFYISGAQGRYPAVEMSNLLPKVVLSAH